MFKKILLIIFLTGSFLSIKAQSDTINGIVDAIYRDSTVEVIWIGSAFKAQKNTPATFQNISPEQYKAINTGLEPSFLLSQLSPSINVYSDAGSTQGYSYYRIRGVDQTRINMTLDAVPLNEPEDQGVYFSNYPDIFNSLSALQIQRGVGLSQNGTASYGGSLQLFSPNLQDSSLTSFGLGYGSFNSYRIFGEYKSGMKKNKAFYVRASHLHSDGYKRNSENSSQSLLYSGKIFLNKHSFKLTGFIGHQQNKLGWLGVSDSLIAIDRRYNANSKQEDDRFIQSLTMFQHEYYPSLHSKISTTLYYNFLTGNYNFDLNNFLGLPSTEELYNYAFRSHFIGLNSNYNVRINSLNVNLGVHGNWYTRRHLGSEKNLGELYSNNGYKQEISTYLKLNYQIWKFNFYADLQYRYSNFSFNGNAKFDALNWHFFNPCGGVTFQLKKNTFLYYSIGNVGREPTRTDIFGGNDDPLADSLGIAQTYITDAEYVLDQELGFRSSGKNWRLGFNLFWMQFRNEIVLNGKFGPNGLALNNSFAKSFRSGVELEGSWEPIRGLVFTNASSFNYSRISDQGVDFQPILTPFLIINQSVAYSFNGFRFGVDARYQSSSFIDFANSAKVEGYFLLNSQISYEIKGWRISFLVNNMLNNKYYNQGYVDYDGSRKFFVQAPVNFYGMVTLSF